MSLPLTIGERVVGAFSFISRTRVFDELDLAIASELADRTAMAIANARLYDDARRARTEAESANRAKDQFLAMLGHELRNPLAPITTALYIMRQRAPEQAARERAVIERQVAHLTRLVDDLLDVSRITRGKIELRRERLALADVVAAAVEMTSPLLESRRHRMTLAVDRQLSVTGDPTRLAQVVANLLANAAKYTPPEGAIEVRAERAGGNIVLRVRDNGMGIPTDMLPSVFDIFVQAPQSRARTQGGMGLGLTIVRSLVELHGGSVSAHSAGQGQGAEIVVTLPAAEPLAQAPGPASTELTAQPRERKQRVLIVDDNADAVMLLAEVLGLRGHAIATAFDGPSALRVADEFGPDVVVLDIGLPVMDGYEVAERLRQSPRHASARLIAVTGYGQESDRSQALASGFHEHLAKPVSAERIVALVEPAS